MLAFPTACGTLPFRLAGVAAALPQDELIFGSLGTGGPEIFLGRPYPGQAFRGLKRREYSDLTGHQKAQRVDRVPDPADIRDDRDPLPLGDMLDPDPEIFPGGAREAGADLVIEPDLIVFQRILHDRPEDVRAFFIGDASLGDDTDDVVREVLDNLDHQFSPSADRP